MRRRKIDKEAKEKKTTSSTERAATADALGLCKCRRHDAYGIPSIASTPAPKERVAKSRKKETEAQ